MARAPLSGSLCVVAAADCAARCRPVCGAYGRNKTRISAGHRPQSAAQVVRGRRAQKDLPPARYVHSARRWSPHPFHLFGHATAQGGIISGMNGGSTVRSRHGDDLGRTRTCHVSKFVRARAPPHPSSMSIRALITRLAFAVCLLIAHFQPIRELRPTGVVLLFELLQYVNFTQPISPSTMVHFGPKRPKMYHSTSFAVMQPSRTIYIRAASPEITNATRRQCEHARLAYALCPLPLVSQRDFRIKPAHNQASQ